MGKTKTNIKFWYGWRRDLAAYLNCSAWTAWRRFDAGDPDAVAWVSEQIRIREKAINQRNKLIEKSKNHMVNE